MTLDFLKLLNLLFEFITLYWLTGVHWAVCHCSVLPQKWNQLLPATCWSSSGIFQRHFYVVVVVVVVVVTGQGLGCWLGENKTITQTVLRRPASSVLTFQCVAGQEPARCQAVSMASMARRKRSKDPTPAVDSILHRTAVQSCFVSNILPRPPSHSGRSNDLDQLKFLCHFFI